VPTWPRRAPASPWATWRACTPSGGSTAHLRPSSGRTTSTAWACDPNPRGIPALAPAPIGCLSSRYPRAFAGPLGVLTWSPPRPAG
jgi:hypothetical protein